MSSAATKLRRSIIAWKTSAVVGLRKSAITSIQGWLGAAGPM